MVAAGSREQLGDKTCDQSRTRWLQGSGAIKHLVMIQTLAVIAALLLVLAMFMLPLQLRWTKMWLAST